MGLIKNPKEQQLRSLLMTAPVVALAAGAGYLLTHDRAEADVDSWPRSFGDVTNTTYDQGVRKDPVNIVFFGQGRADDMKSNLVNVLRQPTPWPICGNGSMQFLFIDDTPHGGPSGTWVWAGGGSQNGDPWDADGAGYNYTRQGECNNTTDPRLHARHFGRATVSSHTDPWAPALNFYSMMAAHEEKCIGSAWPFADECFNHEVISWNEGRNRLWNDAVAGAWLDQTNSFSRTVNNEGFYQGVYHDTVFYLKSTGTGGK